MDNLQAASNNLIDLAPSQQDQDLDQDPIKQQPAPAPIRVMEPAQIDPERYKRAALEVAQQREREMLGSLSQGLAQDPGRAAAIRRLAENRGVPFEFAAQNFDALDRQRREEQIQQMDLARTSPVLFNNLTNPEFAKVAHDDILNLSTRERLSLRFQSGNLTNERGEIGERMRQGIDTQADRDRLDEVERLLARMPQTRQSWLEPAAETLGQMVGMTPQAIVTGLAGGLIGGSAAALLAAPSGPGALAAFGAGFGTGFEYGIGTGVAAGTYTVESGNAYLDMRRANISHESAAAASPWSGLRNAAAELVSFGVVAKPFKMAGRAIFRGAEAAIAGGVTEAAIKPTWGRVLRTAAVNYGESIVAETFVETGQEISNIMAEDYARSLDAIKRGQKAPPSSWSPENLPETMGRLGDIATQTAMAMSVLAFPGPAMRVIAEGRSVKNAENVVDAWKRIASIGALSKLRERDPEAYGKIVKEVAESQKSPNVYFEAGKFRGELEALQRIRAEEIAKEQGISVDEALAQMPSVFRQVEMIDAKVAQDLAAITDDSADIVMPTEVFEQKFAGSKLGDALLQHVRMDRNAQSLFDARKRMDDAKKEFENLTVQTGEKLQQSEEHNRQTAGLEELYYEQLMKTDLYQPDEARAQANMIALLYAMRAVKDGITPEEAFYEAPYTVVRGADPRSVANQILNQRRPRIAALQQSVERLRAAREANVAPEVYAQLQEQHDALVKRFAPVLPYDKVPDPATPEQATGALASDKKPLYGVPSSTLRSGDQVGVRLDIPAYETADTWVVAIHEPRKSLTAGGAGNRIGYESVAHLTNAVFSVSEVAAQKIATGQRKGTIATIEGSWVETTPEVAKAKADAALASKEWRQVGMDPERHSYFYDRETGDPIASAEEVIQIGPLVLARGVKIADKGEFFYSRSKPPAQEVVTASQVQDPAVTQNIHDARLDNLKAAVEQQMPGQDRHTFVLDEIINEKDIPLVGLEDLQGMRIFPTIADRTAAGQMFTGVDGSKTVEIPLLGGPLFMLRASNWLNKVVWANKAESITSAKLSKITRENADVMMVCLGEHDMHASNSTCVLAFLSVLEAYLRDGRIKKKNAVQITNMVREVGRRADESPKSKRPSNLTHFPMLDKLKPGQLREYLDSITFEERKRLFTVLATKEAFSLGLPAGDLILDATREAAMAGHRWGQGVVLVRIDRENPFVELGTEGTTPHPDFPLGIRGTVIGVLKHPVGYDTLWQDWAREWRQAKDDVFWFMQTPEWRSLTTWAERAALVEKSFAEGKLRQSVYNMAKAIVSRTEEDEDSSATEDGGEVAVEAAPKKKRAPRKKKEPEPGAPPKKKSAKDLNPQEYDAQKVGTDIEAYRKKLNIQRSFSMARPVVEVTPELIARIGDISRGNLTGQTQAQVAASFALSQWTSSEQQKDKVTWQQLNNALSRLGLPAYKDAQEKIKKRGPLRVYRLGDAEIFLALEQKGADKVVTAMVDAEQGAPGIAIPAMILKAIELGATKVKLAIEPVEGERDSVISILEAFGFERTGDTTTFTYTGTEESRNGATARYLANGLSGLFGDRTDPDVAAATKQLVRDAQELGAALPESIAAAARRGEVPGDGASLASRTYSAVQDVARLSDAAARNIGLDLAVRDAVRDAVRSGELARDAAVFRQLDTDEPPRTLLATHNIREETLQRLLDGPAEKALLIGPSLAIVNTDVDVVHDFGNITLIGRREMVDPEANPVSVRDADQWTSRFPEIIKLADPDVAKALLEKLGDSRRIIDERWHVLNHYKRGLGYGFREFLAHIKNLSQLDDQSDVGLSLAKADTLNKLQSWEVMNAFSAAVSVLGAKITALTLNLRDGADGLRMVDPTSQETQYVGSKFVAALLDLPTPPNGDDKTTFGNLGLSRLALLFTQAAINKFGSLEKMVETSEVDAYHTGLDVAQEIERMSQASAESLNAIQNLPTDEYIQEFGPDDKKGNLKATIGNIIAGMKAQSWNERLEDMRLGEARVSLVRKKAWLRGSFGPLRAAVSRRLNSIEQIQKQRHALVPENQHVDFQFIDKVKYSMTRIAEKVNDLIADSPDKFTESVLGDWWDRHKRPSEYDIPVSFACALGDLLTIDNITDSEVYDAFVRNGFVKTPGPGPEYGGWRRPSVYTDDYALSPADTHERLRLQSQGKLFAAVVKNIVLDVLAEAVDLKADYFEAKSLGAISIYSFGAAVVPSGSEYNQIADTLAKSHVVTRYDRDEAGSRAQAIKDAAKQLEERRPGAYFFQGVRGAFDPQRLVTMLYGKANLSTFLHETGHFYLHTLLDRASRHNANESDKKDAAELLKWFGVESLDAWGKMTVEEQRKHHEAFAYNFEIYLSEGKAPSVGLQALFSKFASWLKEVYKGLIQSTLNKAYHDEFGTDLPALTGEVRMVMAKMLASEGQIRHAQAVQASAALFLNRADFMGTDAEWDDLQRLMREDMQQAIDSLSAARMKNMRWGLSHRAKLTKEAMARANRLRNEIRAEVEDEVDRMPIYRAMEQMRTGIVVNDGDGSTSDLENHRIDLAYIEERSFLAPDGTQYSTAQIKGRMGVGRGGMLGRTNVANPDAVAESFGFAGPDAGVRMIEAIMSSPTRDDLVEQMTQKRFDEQHGELNSKEAIERQVSEAMANELHARVVATELRALTKALEPERILIAGARQAAREMLAKSKGSDIRPHKHRDAARAAARMANEAMMRGDLDAAILAKRRHLLEVELEREALDILARRDDAVEDLRKFNQPDTKLSKSRDVMPVLVGRILMFLRGMGPASYTREKMEDAVKHLTTLTPELWDRLQPMVLEADSDKRTYLELTVAEFDALHDMLKGIWTLSRRMRESDIEGERVSTDDIVMELAKVLIERHGAGNAVTPGRVKAVTDREVAAMDILSIRSGVRRVESWCEAMDGSTDGPFTRYIWRPIKNALTRYRTERKAMNARLQKLFDEHEFDVRPIVASEIGYTFRNKAELLAAMLHMGNKSNYERLILAVERPWGTRRADGTLDATKFESFIQRCERDGIITQADWAFISGIWQANESMKPQVAKAHYELTGFPMPEVKHHRVKTMWGEIDGGYVPAITDKRMVKDAATKDKLEQLEANPLNTMPTTGRGMTKARVNYTHALSLDLGLVRKHLEDALRFVHVEPRVVEVLRVIRNREFTGIMGAVDSSAIEGMLIPWLVRAAKQQIGQPGMFRAVDRFWSIVRSRAALLTMAGNVVNSLQQFTGLFVAMTKVPPLMLARAFIQFMGGKLKTRVKSLSAYMLDRFDGQMFELADRINEVQVNPSRFQKLQSWVDRHKYFAQSFVQEIVDTVAWSAAYDDAVARGKSNDDAVQHADSVIRLTQGESTAESVSRIETGSPFARTLTQFMGYFNTMANLNVTAYQKTIGQMGWGRGSPKLLTAWALSILAPAVVSQIISGMIRGTEDDDDDGDTLDDLMASAFLAAPAKATFAMIPGGVVGNAIVGQFTKARYDDRMMSTPAVAALESSLAGLRALATFDVTSTRKVKDVTTLMTMISGLPAMSVSKAIGAAERVQAILDTDPRR